MTPQLISVQDCEGHSPVRTYRFECEHETKTALLIPPKECPTCRDLRHTRETEERVQRAVITRNRTRAFLEAENAHDYGKPHMVCYYCVQSLSADMYAFGESMADIFSARKIRGFKR